MDVYSTGKSTYRGCSISRQTRRFWVQTPVSFPLNWRGFLLSKPFCWTPLLVLCLHSVTDHAPAVGTSPCDPHLPAFVHALEAAAGKLMLLPYHEEAFLLNTSSGCSGGMNSQPCPGQSSPGHWDGLGLVRQQVSPQETASP